MFCKAGTGKQQIVFISNGRLQVFNMYGGVELHYTKISDAILRLSASASWFKLLSICLLPKYSIIKTESILPTSSSCAIGQPPIPFNAPSNLLQPACTAASSFSFLLSTVECK